MKLPPAARPAPPARQILVVKIDPETRACTLMKMEQSPAGIQGLTGKAKLGFQIVAKVRNVDVAVAADNSAPAVGPRFHLESAPICHGVGVVFGFNGKAITTPVDAIWVLERITWLDPE